MSEGQGAIGQFPLLLRSLDSHPLMEPTGARANCLKGKLLHYRCIQLQLFPQTSASSHRLVTLQSSIFSLILSSGPAVFDQRPHSTPFLFFLIWYESKKKKKETNSKPLVCKISSEKKMLGLSWWSSSKESACQCRGHGFHPWSRKIGHVGGAAKPSCHSH